MASLISKERSIKYDTHSGVRKNSLNSKSENYDGLMNLQNSYSTLVSHGTPSATKMSYQPEGLVTSWNSLHNVVRTSTPMRYVVDSHNVVDSHDLLVKTSPS